MGAPLTLSWPSAPSADLTTLVHHIVTLVGEDGGSTPWPVTPEFGSVHEWLYRLTTAVVQGDAALCVASVGGTPKAVSAWRRSAGVGRSTAARAEMTQVMALPDPDQGLAAAVATAVIASARGAGVDVLQIGVRPDDEAGQEIYTALGFVVTGDKAMARSLDDPRRPDVRMLLKVGTPGGQQI